MTDMPYINKLQIPGRGLVFGIESPVACTRDYQHFVEAYGSDHMTFDGVRYKIRGIEMFQPGTPIAIGEKIGILTAPEATPQEKILTLNKPFTFHGTEEDKQRIRDGAYTKPDFDCFVLDETFKVVRLFEAEDPEYKHVAEFYRSMQTFLCTGEGMCNADILDRLSYDICMILDGWSFTEPALAAMKGQVVFDLKANSYHGDIAAALIPFDSTISPDGHVLKAQNEAALDLTPRGYKVKGFLAVSGANTTAQELEDWLNDTQNNPYELGKHFVGISATVSDAEGEEYRIMTGPEIPETIYEPQIERTTHEGS